jgi:tRNA pseudouridine13 synthase
VKPVATIRRSPEDFRVEEIPAFAPCGEGEHLYLDIVKTNLTTNEAVRRICYELRVDEGGAGYAGMKDKRAVASQTISVPFARDRSHEEALRLELEGIVIEKAVRHGHKLKPGHLKGNRFSIALRGLDRDRVPEVVRELDEAGRRGVPNAFGPQRFGRDGDNPERALTWLAGRAPGPKDRRDRRLLFSALQAELFNRVLARRQAEGIWNVPLAGDLLRKCDTGGIFVCSEPVADTERALRAEICPTGPLFGAKMRWPEGEPAKIEREILQAAVGDNELLERHRALGEGTRRAFVLHVRDLAIQELRDDQGALLVVFVLPKGGYATTLLACAVTLQEEKTVT